MRNNLDIWGSMPHSVWHEDAAVLAWKLDRKGLVIPGSDAVIAASAIAIGAAVLISDAHFKHIEDLRLIAPPKKWFS